jgi:ribosomal protein S18 acetylase RimI-like enzyme
MTDEMSIELLDYDESLAEDIAGMWNTWDELWPGGFTQGVPYTAERVHKQFGKSDALAILIALDTERKKPVGSCTLFAHWRDTEAAYIGTLGVSPEALGKKVGKRLLLESIERASKKGYTRVDLNTWAGNMKAVPLYKKIGMMWNPEISGVQMEDYIPGILHHPLCHPFFVPLSGNSDWYDVHVREPTQAPDEYEIDGLAVYPYKFANGNDELSVVVDRYGRGISSVDRKFGESRLKVMAKTNTHQVLCGLHYEYTLVIENDTNSEIVVSANLEGFEGLVWDGDSSVSKRIESGKKLEWNVSYHLNPSAPLYRDGIKSPVITTKLEVDGQKSELVSGLKVQPAAEIKTRWGPARIVSGGKTSIPLTVVNNLPSKGTAKLLIDSINGPISVTPDSGTIKLAAEGFGGATLNVSSEPGVKEGSYDIWVSLEIDSGKNQKITTRKFRIPIFCLGEKGIAVGHDDIHRRQLIVSPIYNAYFNEEGAILRIQNQYSAMETRFQVRSAIGPPFGINPFRFAERETSVTESDRETIVAMKATHPNRSLDIEDRVRFEHGTGIIIHEVWVTNTNSESETFQLRLYGRGGGISFSEGTMYVPLSSGILKEKLGNFYTGYPAIPGEPSTFAEGWIANEQEGVFKGQLWDHSKIEEVQLGDGQINMLSYPQVTLEPKETRRLSQLWLVYGVQSWSHVRRLWRTRVNEYFEDPVESYKQLSTKPLVNLDSNPIAIPYLQDAQCTINLTKSTIVPLNGVLRYVAPVGWNASLTPKDTEMEAKVEGSIASGAIQFTHDTTFHLKLKPDSNVPDAFGIHKGLIEFKSDWLVRKPLKLINLGSSKGSVEVLDDVDQGLNVFRVKNGLIEYTVSPDFGGCLISLKNEKNVEFLANSFPTPAPKPGGFFDNYYGGVQPIVFDDDMGEDLDKARTNKEKMSGKSIEIGYWKGVEIEWVGKIQKLAKGVDFKLRYLTAVRSPLVLIQWVITNKTSAPMKFWPMLMVDPDLSKQLAGFSYQTEWDNEVTELKQGMVPIAVTPSKNYAWLKPQNTQDTTGFSFMIAGNESRMIAASLGEMMLLGGINSLTWLKPGEKKVITAGILVDPHNIEDVRCLQEVLDKI